MITESADHPTHGRSVRPGENVLLREKHHEDLYDYEGTLDYAARRDGPDNLAVADQPSDPEAPVCRTTPLGDR